MKKHKNRMQLKALKTSIKKLNGKVANRDGAIQVLIAEADKYKTRLQMACDVIGSELDNNDLLRAMLCDAQLITYNGPDYMQVESRQPRFDFAVPLSVAVTPESFTLDFIYKFGQFVNEHIEKVHFGKIYEVNHNGKRKCLFLDGQSINNIPYDYLASRYLPELISGLKKQCS